MAAGNFTMEPNFVSEVPDYLICSCCHTVLHKPLVSIKCGHRFCFNCIEELKKYTIAVGNPLLCPVDRNELALNEICEDLTTGRIICNLAVRCNFSGCRWDGVLQDLEDHLAGCSFSSNNKEISMEDLVKKLSSDLENYILVKNNEIATLKLEVNHRREETEVIRKEFSEFKENMSREMLALKSQFLDERASWKHEEEQKASKLEKYNKKMEDRIARLEDESVTFVAEIRSLKTEDDKKTKEIVDLREELMELHSKYNNHFKSSEEKAVEFENRYQVIDTKLNDNCAEIEKLANQAMLNVKEISAKKTVIEWKLEDYAYHRSKPVGRKVFGPKFYSRVNGKRLQLFVTCHGDNKDFCVGLRACRRKHGGVEEPFNMIPSFCFISSTGKKEVRNFPREDYDLFLKQQVIEPGENYSQGRSLRCLTQPKLKDFIIDDSITVTCTLEPQ